MAEEYDVTFSNAFLKLANDMAVIALISHYLPEDDAKMFKKILRAFAKHGVPANIVIDAIKDIAMESGFENG